MLHALLKLVVVAAIGVVLVRGRSSRSIAFAFPASSVFALGLTAGITLAAALVLRGDRRADELTRGARA